MLQTLTPAHLSFWVTASLVLSVVACNLAWLLTRSRFRLKRLAGLAAWPGVPAVAWLLTGAYLLLPPVTTWRLRLLSPYYLGLTENDWLAALGAPAALALAIAGLTLAGWIAYRRSLLYGPFAPAPAAAAASPIERWTRGPLSAALWQWHWAFYRAAAIAWLAAGAVVPPVLAPHAPWLAAWASSLLESWGLQPIYWGSWLGLGIAALEFWLNPFARESLRIPGHLEGVTRTAGLAISTTALFSLSRNFWLCLGCSLVVEIAVAGWFPVPTEVDAGPAAAGPDSRQAH